MICQVFGFKKRWPTQPGLHDMEKLLVKVIRCGAIGEVTPMDWGAPAAVGALP